MPRALYICVIVLTAILSGMNSYAQTVPTLSCPGQANVLDWDVESWVDGNLSDSFTVAGETIAINFADPNNTLVNNVITGQPSPSQSTTISGGLSPVQGTVALFANHPSTNSSITLTIDLGTPGEGVEQFQTAFFDVDFGANQFQDRVFATGSLAGNPVAATYITGITNAQIGAEVLGQTPSPTLDPDGNLVVRFLQPVDQVVIEYGSGPNAPADPGLQAIAMFDIEFCDRLLANIEGQKTTEIFDPDGLGLYAIPGNDVIYTITMTNTGTGAADSDSVIIIDSMPPEIEFYNGDIDDGGPFIDPVIGVDAGTGLTLDYVTDVGFSDAASKPADFSECTYVPAAGYDPNVNFICVNPSGAMAAGDPDPSFAISFRARIE